MKAKKIFILLSMCMIHIVSSAQIGYQVSLLNSATGEPRASETVSVNITLSNSEGKIIHTETKTETTNDFGILSLAVGNENTFNDVDWNKLPFFISVSVDGKLVGKSQILTVPVAEYAKKTGVLTKEILCSKTWYGTYYDNTVYYTKYECVFTDKDCIIYFKDYGEDGYSGSSEIKGTYLIDGNEVIFTYNLHGSLHAIMFKFANNTLYRYGDIRGVVLR